MRNDRLQYPTASQLGKKVLRDTVVRFGQFPDFGKHPVAFAPDQTDVTRGTGIVPESLANQLDSLRDCLRANEFP